MKKHTIAQLVLLCTLVAGLLLFLFTQWHFSGGFIAGCAATMLLLDYLGRKQSREAVNIIQKKINDYYENNGTKADLSEE
jgi:hypothetical protein